MMIPNCDFVIWNIVSLLCYQVMPFYSSALSEEEEQEVAAAVAEPTAQPLAEV